ncbi:MAG: endo-1,4-beta-xylanase [Kiritimatiellae bacterium]|nr:endo-1,4-beta-xylanase [Kiritimatiellia bacterium]
MKKTIAFVAIVLCFGLTSEAADIDRSLMSDAYWAIWNDAEQARIDADIERNRKADGVFEVDAPDGEAVRVEQLTHDFRFGAHIFNFNQLGSKKCNYAYKASYGAGGLFNQATVSFYWIDHEPTPGAFRFGGDYSDTERYWNSLSREEAMRERYWRRPAPGPVIDFLKAKDVAIHGHILIWGNAKPYWIYDWYCPESEKRVIDELGIPRHSAHFGLEPCGQNWHMGYMGKWAKAWRGAYKDLDEKSLAAKISVFAANMRRVFRKRAFDVAGAYGDVVDSFDVVNESAQDWVRYRKARTGLPVWFSNYGLMPGDYPLHALLDAKEAFPASARLAINDYKIDDSFLEQTRQLVDEGARIDIVGCQMHIFNTNDCTRLVNGATDVKWVGTPQTIRARLDMMARTGRPLHVSEVTIAAPGEDARSRDIQAVLVRNIYRAWFSHPAAMGITWWNTVDGAGVAGEPLVSGLFTRDLEKKPAYHALDRLINHEWKTSLDAKASAGKVAFRGFKGRYRLAWKGADGKPRTKTVELK